MTKKEKDLTRQVKMLEKSNEDLADQVRQLGIQLSMQRSEVERGRANEQRARFEATRQRRRVEALQYHAVLAHDHATAFEKELGRLRGVDTRDNVALAVAPEEHERPRS